MASKYVVALLLLITLNTSLFGCMREYGWGNKSIIEEEYEGIEITVSPFNEDFSRFASSPSSSYSSPLSSSPSALSLITYNQIIDLLLPPQKKSNSNFDEEFQELAKIEIE